MQTSTNPAALILRTLKRLKSVREEREIAQTEIALRLGVTRQAVSAWESGAAFPSADKLFFWAHALGLSLELTE